MTNINFIQSQVNTTPKNISATLQLLSEDCTIPFISRYRKDQTGNLDEVVIEQIAKLSKQYDEIVKRKESILKTIEEQGQLSPELKAKIERYESDPTSGEGKKELMAKARKLEEDRAVAKSRSPWYTYAGSLFQIAIVLLTASILAVNNRLYKASIGVGALGALLMSQALWLWLPIVL